MAKQKTTIMGDELKALLLLLKAGYKVTLHKRINKLQTISRFYTPDDFGLLIDKDKIRGQDAADEAAEENADLMSKAQKNEFDAWQCPSLDNGG